MKGRHGTWRASSLSSSSASALLVGGEGIASDRGGGGLWLM